MTKKLPPKVEDFLRELFGEDGWVKENYAQNAIVLSNYSERIWFDNKKLQKRYEGMMK